jgi:Dockerin type I domain/Thrombospondin type 3 repeat
MKRHPTARWAACVLLACLASAAYAQSTDLPDTDKDGVPDAIDNCTQAANPDQTDIDNDGFGNACDADINNDGVVNAVDIGLMKTNFGKRQLAGDINGDGIINAQDLSVLKRLFGQKPGPSALTQPTLPDDGRKVPVARSVDISTLSPALKDGRNALVSMDFGPFFLRDEKTKLPPFVAIHADGDIATLRKLQLTSTDLGRPLPLGNKAGEIVVLNDLGLFGDDKAGDGVFTGLTHLNLEQIRRDETDFLERARKAQATRMVVFNGREAVANREFDLANPFDVPTQPDRELTLRLPGVDAQVVKLLALPKLKLLLPPTTDPMRTLMITNTGVLQDPGRAFSPCNNAGNVVPTGNVNGPWSFKTLLSNMANTPVTGISAQVFINDWLKLWLSNSVNVKHSDGVGVPSFPIPSRPALLTVIQSLQPGWNPANPATLDLNKLPFRLLAIVNRIDLAQSGYAGTGSPGELRFVFGLLERNGAGTCVPSNEMTVILEYKVPTSTCTGLKMLAQDWIALDSLVPGSAAYNGQLQTLTDQVSLPNAFPGRVNASAIGQVRTNEVRLRLPWELREFTLQKSPVFGKLLPETVKNNPDSSHNRTALMTAWINGAGGSGAEVPRQLGGGDFIGTANRYGPGVPHPTSPTDKANPAWDGLPAADPFKRFRVSSNTCGGCHLSETGTSFTMIKANGALGAPAALAGFLTGITVNDAEHGAPPLPGMTHSFNDLFRRGQLLDQIAAKSCLLLPHLPLFQAVEQLRVPPLPESVFGPRFVH